MDWEGKVALIQAAQAMGVQRYVFTSIYDCDRHPEVPLMNIKACTEAMLAASGLRYTNLRLCGFMQARAGALAGGGERGSAEARFRGRWSAAARAAALAPPRCSPATPLPSG